MPGLLDVLGLRAAAGAGQAVANQAGQAPSPPTVSRDEAAFQAERAAVAKLADALRADPQAARIRSQTIAIGTKQGSALHHASKKEWGAAMRDLAEARAGCMAAKALAAQWAEYATLLATANAKVSACMGVSPGNEVATAQRLIATAAAGVKGSPPNFTGARTDFAAVDSTLKSLLVDLGARQKAMLAALTAQDADLQAFVASDIAKAQALIATMDAAIAAGDWSQTMMSALAASDVLSPAIRFAERRSTYEAQRLATVGAIASIKANPETQDRAAEVEAMLASADALATRETLKIEEGVRLLVDAKARCDLLHGLIATIAAHKSERALADAEAAALDKHKAAGEVKTERDAIAKLLADAATAATQAKAQADPTAAFNTALEGVRRARADLAEAKKLADGLGPSGAAKQAAQASPPKAEALRKALGDLKTSAAAAAKAPGADRVAELLARFKERADVATQALAPAKNDAKGAAGPVQEAAQALAQALTVQAEHGRFTASVGAVEDKLKAMRAWPTAASIKPRIDAVAAALAKAKASDQRQAGPDAMAALRQATDAVAAAEKAGRDRSIYNAWAKRVGDRINAEVTDANARRTMLAAVAAATRTADALRFADAQKAVLAVDLELDGAKLKAGASRRPPPADLQASAKRITDKGGGKVVDDLIKSLPDTIDPKVLEALAAGRYEVAFKIEGSAPGVEEVKTMKRMCEMFKTMPENIRGNHSIQKISNVDRIGDVVAGYTSSTASIKVAGRVGAQHQKFGKYLTERDPKTRKEVSQLPKNIDPDCQPVNEKQEVEFIGFSAAHEVGHGLDDERGYMVRHGEEESKGGWADHGGDIEPVAVAVGADIAAKFPASTFNKSAESRKYIRDKLANRPTTRPDTPKGSDDRKAFDAFDRWHALATSPGVYKRQPDCDAIKIGTRIYHEAYARNWVSYLAAARSKGLTGYQFRSRAEWFAELYAGWKAKKLGPKHPALEWLTKL